MTPDAPRAWLAEDEGEASQSQDFFRSPQFLAAEGVTHSLIVESADRRLAIPLLVRDTPDGGHVDAISPYGYPGGRLTPADAPALAGDDVDWGPTGLVSAFIRYAVGVPVALDGAAERSLVQVSDPDLPRKSRMSDRQQIRRNERDGYEIGSVPGPEADDAAIDALTQVYRETMLRASADERYLYDRTWFGAVLAAECSRLFLVRAADGSIAAAALVVESDGFVHYYLSGTSDEHSRASPSKNLIVAVTEHAEAQGAPMNLGGGLRAGDSLEAFKQGFANRELPFMTHELVCDPAAYESLSAGAGETAFFPRYRAPANA
ncbi:MAG: GNAT family N-acetyltransferase [Solirubrobacterales bacterium]